MYFQLSLYMKQTIKYEIFLLNGKIRIWVSTITVINLFVKFMNQSSLDSSLVPLVKQGFVLVFNWLVEHVIMSSFYQEVLTWNVVVICKPGKGSEHINHTG